MAREGLARWGVDADEAERLLSVIEQRCVTGRNGATWQRSSVAARERAGQTRAEALHGMLRDYLELARAGEPVHTWE